MTLTLLRSTEGLFCWAALFDDAAGGFERFAVRNSGGTQTFDAKYVGCLLRLMEINWPAADPYRPPSKVGWEIERIVKCMNGIAIDESSPMARAACKTSTNLATIAQ